jgi:hypothetical protein
VDVWFNKYFFTLATRHCTVELKRKFSQKTRDRIDAYHKISYSVEVLAASPMSRDFRENFRFIPTLQYTRLLSKDVLYSRLGYSDFDIF